MALQNLDISETLLNLGVYLKTNKNINDFCRTQFTKELKVYAGDFLRKDIPEVKDCPYIVLTDFKKKEGQNIEFCEYKVTVFLGVGSDKLEYVEEQGVIIPDIYDVGAKLMTLIEQEFNNPEERNRPISRIDTSGLYPLNPAGTHWVGRMDIAFRIYQTLGTTYQEEL
jgi:hypothetical protein